MGAKVTMEETNVVDLFTGKPLLGIADEELPHLPGHTRVEMAEAEIKAVLFEYFGGEPIAFSLGVLEGCKHSLLKNACAS